MIALIFAHILCVVVMHVRDNAPDIVDMSTVADFNDNLLYHMRREQGLDNFVGLSTNHLHELEKTLRSNKYLGSFLTTKASVPQPAHVDFDWKVLQQCEENSQSLMIGFFPLTKEGALILLRLCMYARVLDYTYIYSNFFNVIFLLIIILIYHLRIYS